MYFSKLYLSEILLFVLGAPLRVILRRKEGQNKQTQSAYLFTLVLEIVCIMIKSNQNIQPINIFDYDFLYTAYADDTTFLSKTKIL